MNRFIKYAVAVAITGSALAQTPSAPPTKTLDEMNSEFQLDATKAQLLYNRLRDLRDFQDYLQTIQDMDKLRVDIQTAQKQQSAPAKASTNPKKP